MRIPTEIGFSGLEPSATLESGIHTLLTVLEPFCGWIVGCRVALANRGRSLDLKVTLTVLGGDLVVERTIPRPTHASVIRACSSALEALIPAVMTTAARVNDAPAPVRVRETAPRARLAA